MVYKNGGKSKWMGSLVTLIGFPVIGLFHVFSTIRHIVSSILLVFNNESQATKVSKGKYAIGLLCTVAASAGNGLMMSLVQLILRKILKKNTLSVVTDLVFYQSLVATCVLLVGFFTSGEWETLNSEKKSYKIGEVSYVMTLVFTAITWQVYAIGIVGLISESSSMFSNAVTAVGLPIVPTLAVVVFDDKMDGTKVISVVLAVWGFISFSYQHYLDDKKLENLEAVPDLPVSSPDKEDKHIETTSG